MAMKRPEGIFPYTSNDAWSQKLADAVRNTCELENLTAAPRQAIIEGLASALGDDEIKKLLTTQQGRKVLAPNAHRVVQAGDERVLLLTAAVHGAGVVPWDLNDRVVGGWTPPGDEARQRVETLVDAECALEETGKSVRQSELERDAQRRADADEPYAAAALAAAESKLAEARERQTAAEQTHKALLRTLGGRRPRPAVTPAEEDGHAAAALTLAPQTYDVAVHMQRYAVENLRRLGRGRGYDLVESLVAAGQLTRGMCVLQQWNIQDRDGEACALWRMVAVTANNRTLARLDIFGVLAEHLVTGMPQSRFPLPTEASDPDLLLRNQREVLKRISWRYNEARNSQNTDPDHAAFRAAKITSVPTEIVVGCSSPRALEHSLRALNINDHLRGIQPYDEDVRLVALWATLVDSYTTERLLGPLLADTFPGARGIDRLDLDGVRAALTANGPLAPLAPLLPSDTEADESGLRDAAVRCVTAMVFPDVPSDAGNAGRKVRDTGRFWPVVRGTLQEPAWSQIRSKHAESRTRLWSAAVAQLFLHRSNILSAQGLFTARSETKEGAHQDPRPLNELLLTAEAGDATAWTALVRRMVPNLIHAPEPMITPGQGSEAGESRKGVRRTPSNAVSALTLAYTNPAPNVSRELLIAFARSVLAHPDATEAPVSPDGSPVVVYGERSSDPARRSTLVPGMVLAPDTSGMPTSFVADKAWFDELFPPEDIDRTQQLGSSSSPSLGTTAASASNAKRVEGTTQDSREQLRSMRQELPPRIELVEASYERAIQSANALLADFELARRLREDLNEESLPADTRIAWMEKLSKARAAAESSVDVLGQVEALILKL
ncbi:hypothetical protein ACIA78_32995 [Streptomyces xanthochromogenes]|uniref:hypothetical protein n=1 Tax=Streptomyces xanthochromogenes TaxID=67384 RepID=UPI0037BA3FF6